MKRIMYADGNSKVGKVKVFACPKCRDGKRLKALERVAKEAAKACADLDPEYDCAEVLTKVRKALKALEA